MELSGKNRSELTRTLAASGEPMVWVTAMGLSVGLLMVVGLLGVIVANGIPVFWPKAIYEWRLRPGVVNPVPGGGDVVVGELAAKRLKRVPVVGEDGKPVKDQTERQIFVGNKEVYGQGFVFVNGADIVGMEKAHGVYRLERMEYGVAFGVPERLRLGSGREIRVEDKDFWEQLKGELRRAAVLRKRIRGVEKVEIGRINAALNDLRVRGGEEGKVAELEARYEELAAVVQRLREEKMASVLIYRTPTSDERRIEVGDLLSIYDPNALGFLERLGIFLRNVVTFLMNEPREANTEGGIFPAIFGTFLMTLLMSVAVVPFGVVAAIYLREYAKQGFWVRAVRISVNNLAGVPSIVFGVFGLGFFVYLAGGSVDRLFFSEYLPTPTFGTGGILWASLTLALMTVPVVIVATEEAVAAVPRGMKEGSLACGASKWQTVQRIILPASLPGILTGLILAMARGAGEVAPLMLVGVVKLAPSLPLDGEFPYLHLERKFMHLGFHIYDLGFQSPDSEAAKPMVFATTLLLILLVVVLNLAAILLRDHLRKKYSTGAF